jgi:hypothetical protein
MPSGAAIASVRASRGTSSDWSNRSPPVPARTMNVTNSARSTPPASTYVAIAAAGTIMSWPANRHCVALPMPFRSRAQSASRKRSSSQTSTGNAMRNTSVVGTASGLNGSDVATRTAIADRAIASV